MLHSLILAGRRHFGEYVPADRHRGLPAHARPPRGLVRLPARPGDPRSVTAVTLRGSSEAHQRLRGPQWLAARTAAMLVSMSSSVVFQPLTLTRMAVRPCQAVGPHQQVPSRWIAAITESVRAAFPKSTTTWLRTTSLSTLN